MAALYLYLARDLISFLSNGSSVDSTGGIPEAFEKKTIGLGFGVRSQIGVRARVKIRARVRGKGQG